jgi:hypothetical protein
MPVQLGQVRPLDLAQVRSGEVLVEPEQWFLALIFRSI